MEYIKLSNGVKVPLFGIGTFMISSSDTEESIYAAIKLGYRLIDTANAYSNEKSVGIAVKRAIDEGIVKREELFISTKLWASIYENENAVLDTLKRLDMDYVDLLFIHQPSGNYMAGYRQLEKAYKEGRAKSLGISNFYDEELEELLGNSEIKPHIMQLEAHPYWTQKKARERIEEYNIHLMGWYPLGHGDANLIKEEVFTKLADKYRKSNVQIILRWATQMQFITIPGSKSLDHIRTNIDIFDFKLTEEEMLEIAKLDGTKKYYNSSKEDIAKYADMHLPFE